MVRLNSFRCLYAQPLRPAQWHLSYLAPGRERTPRHLPTTRFGCVQQVLNLRVATLIIELSATYEVNTMKIGTLTTHNTTTGYVDTTFTQKQGTIHATPNQIEKAFGLPILYEQDEYTKSTTEWEIEFISDQGIKVIATIYDWKRIGAPALNQSITWHIGGHDHYAVELVHQAFRQAHDLALAYA